MTSTLTQHLPFTPNNDQLNALTVIEDFLDKASTHNCLILRGAAGTGKTAIMKAVTDLLIYEKVGFEVLAPTGRAAKNIGQKVGQRASTVHSCLYIPQTDVEEAVIRLYRKANEDLTQRVYVVDESSMLSNRLDTNGDFVASNPLLTDLISFVRQGNAQSKIIFIGDDYQLPPVGYQPDETSPALNAQSLVQMFGLKAQTVTLSQVERQRGYSPILAVASQLRLSLEQRRSALPRTMGGRFSGAKDAVNLYLDRYQQGVHDRVAIVSLSNTYVNECNALIRAELGLSGPLAVGDTVVLGQNYQSMSYVASGEAGVVSALDSRLHRVADLCFQEAEITFTEASSQPLTIRSLVLLDSLRGSISREQRKALFAAEMRNNPRFRERKDIRESAYLSALSLRYGHALTCHKEQGSEWDTVILNTWSKTPDLRFLYTGVTRARHELFTNGACYYAKVG